MDITQEIAVAIAGLCIGFFGGSFALGLVIGVLLLAWQAVTGVIRMWRRDGWKVAGLKLLTPWLLASAVTLPLSIFALLAGWLLGAQGLCTVAGHVAGWALVLCAVGGPALWWLMTTSFYERRDANRMRPNGT